MMTQYEIERFYWNAAGCAVDLLRARLGIPEPVPFKPRAQTPVVTAPARAPLIDRPRVIGAFLRAFRVVMTTWSKA